MPEGHLSSINGNCGVETPHVKVAAMQLCRTKRHLENVNKVAVLQLRMPERHSRIG